MKLAKSVSNAIGIRNLCEGPSKFLRTMPVNVATTFTVCVPMRDAVNKSNPNYRGNGKKNNVRHVSVSALPYRIRTGPAAAEHMVPISLMLDDHLYAVRDLVTETEALVRLANQYDTLALISKHEDALLYKHKLQSKVPADRDSVDCFARYRAVGIEVVPFEALEARKLVA